MCEKTNASWEITVLKRTLILLLLWAPFTANAAPTITGGQLTGFSNVNVNGNLFDVVLTTQSCVELYSGCVEITDFPFSITDAAAAVSELAAQVSASPGTLLPGITSILDCAFNQCLIAIADGLQGSNFSQTTFEIRGTAGTVGGVGTRGLGSDDRIQQVFANFTAVAVPLPTTVLLVMVGLAGLFGAKRLRAV